MRLALLAIREISKKIKNLYDADVEINGKIDDGDLAEITKNIVENEEYALNN